MKTFFSIIIPVYNAESYLHKCIGSVLRQTFTDYEIILIDDGSEDFSASICRMYEEKHTCISFYHISHSGAGAARNVGLEKSKGMYVLFFDADDYWNNNELLSTVYDRIQYNFSEIVMFQISKVTENGKILKRYKKKSFGQGNKVHQLSECIFRCK